MQNAEQNRTTLEKITHWAFVGFVCSLFFDVKIPLAHQYAYFLGEKKDFTIIFIHLTDLTLAVFVLCAGLAWWRTRSHAPKNKTYALLSITMLASAVVSAILRKADITIPILSIYYLLYITKFHVLHGTLIGYKKSLLGTFGKTFISIGVLEVLVEIYQFANQRSFGIQKLGESFISPYLPSVAKVEALGQVFVRGYGTFPHPNILGAFLVVALTMALFTLKNETAANRMSKIITVIILILGLFISFSRAGWLAGCAVLLIYGCTVLARGIGQIRKSTIFEITSYICAIVIMTSIFLPFVNQRGNVFDKAYTERISYNYAGISIIQNYPLFGIGPSESMIHMEQLLAKNTLPSEIQPIHNYFLITAAEIGALSAAAFLLFCFWQLWVVGRNLLYKRNMVEEINFAPYVALFSCVILMFFDHYFYTFQPAGLLLWLIIGLVAQETFSPKNTTS